MIGFMGLFDAVHDYTLQFTITRTCTITSRCPVAASIGRCPPSSGFLKCPWPELPVSRSSRSQQFQLNSSLTVLLIASQHGVHRKHLSSVAVYGSLPSNSHCLVVCFMVIAWEWVYMPRYLFGFIICFALKSHYSTPFWIYVCIIIIIIISSGLLPVFLLLPYYFEYKMPSNLRCIPVFNVAFGEKMVDLHLSFRQSLNVMMATPVSEDLFSIFSLFKYTGCFTTLYRNF
jgi:hypothetical protein